MQQLQESAVRQVYPAGWPKIHHLPRLPLPRFLLSNCFPRSRDTFRVSLVHVTYRSILCSFVPYPRLLPLGVTLLPLFLSIGPKLTILTPLLSYVFSGMQSSSPCIPPVAWPEENPPVGKNFRTNSVGDQPSDLGSLPTGPGSYIGVVQRKPGNRSIPPKR